MGLKGVNLSVGSGGWLKERRSIVSCANLDVWVRVAGLRIKSAVESCVNIAYSRVYCGGKYVARLKNVEQPVSEVKRSVLEIATPLPVGIDLKCDVVLNLA